MVVSKRKKDSKEPVSTTPELKRTKIQAQRKFAQGQQPPSSAYLTYNLTTGSDTPAKEKSQERELLPNVHPNTEDFLTFLCFRGTNSLPKELDFQNTLNQPSTSGTTVRASNKIIDKSCEDVRKEYKKKLSVSRTVTSVKEKSTGNPAKDPKTGYMPFAVRKRAEIHPAKSKKKNFQPPALKKKPRTTSDGKNVEALGELRFTRSTPVQENPNESAKKITKRKSAATQSGIDTSITQSNTAAEASSQNPSEIFKKESPSKASNEEDKRRTRLSLAKNTSIPPKECTKNGNGSSDFDKYFTSDDDNEPLVKSEPKNKKAKLLGTLPKPVSSLEDTKLLKKNSQVIKSKRGRKKGNFSQPEFDEKKKKTLLEPEKCIENAKTGRKKKN